MMEKAKVFFTKRDYAGNDDQNVQGIGRRAAWKSGR